MRLYRMLAPWMSIITSQSSFEATSNIFSMLLKLTAFMDSS